MGWGRALAAAPERKFAFRLDHVGLCDAWFMDIFPASRLGLGRPVMDLVIALPLLRRPDPSGVHLLVSGVPSVDGRGQAGRLHAPSKPDIVALGADASGFRVEINAYHHSALLSLIALLRTTTTSCLAADNLVRHRGLMI